MTAGGSKGSKAMPVTAHVKRALRALERRGLLLLQDAKLPSLVGLIAGEPVRGSWWGHPKGSEIFHAAGKLDDHPDVTSTKILSGKVTFVHRSLWPQLIAIGRSREAWQTEGLPKEAQILLDRVDEETRVRTSGKAAKTLEQRLLVASQEVHTESGAHALDLLTWKAFARDMKVRLPRFSAAKSRAEIEQRVDAMNAEFDAKGKVPWAMSRKRRT